MAKKMKVNVEKSIELLEKTLNEHLGNFDCWFDNESGFDRCTEFFNNAIDFVKNWNNKNGITSFKKEILKLMPKEWKGGNQWNYFIFCEA